MRTIRIGSVACTLAIVAAVSVAPSHAQPASQTPQAALTKEAGTLSDKFSGMARVMAGKYDWEPDEGVRSVGDVFNLIVRENGMLAGTLTGAGGGRGGAPITDPEKMLPLAVAFSRISILASRVLPSIHPAAICWSGELHFFYRGLLRLNKTWLSPRHQRTG